jgi:hypothetical protein
MHGTRLAVLTMSAIAVGVLAGCSSSSSSASGGAPQSASASGSASSTPTASAATTAPAAAFAPIVEPFDPGHPARALTTPASCGSLSTTLAIEKCYEDKAETYDAQIDLVQRSRYQSGNLAQQLDSQPRQHVVAAKQGPGPRPGTRKMPSETGPLAVSTRRILRI